MSSTRATGWPPAAGHADLVADVVAGQRRVLPDEVQGLQDAAVGAGRLQVQRDIDQIGGMIAGVGGSPDGLGGHLPRPCRIQDHPEPPANEVPVPLSRAGRRVHGGDLLSQPQIPAHMIDHRSRHRLRRREVPQPAEALQPDHQGQHMLIRPRRTPGPRHLIRLRREEHVQFPRRKQPLEPRIRRPLDRCHLRRPPCDPTRSTHTDRGKGSRHPNRADRLYRSKAQSRIHQRKHRVRSSHGGFCPYLGCTPTSTPATTAVRGVAIPGWCG